MSNSDETLEQPNKDEAILNAIADLAKRFDSLEKSVNERFVTVENQLEIIREGIVYNSSKFDRLEATVYNSRGDVANLRADIKDLTEEVRQVRKANLVTLEK